MHNKDWKYYSKYLKGLDEHFPSEFLKLAQLVELELLDFWFEDGKCRLVYLMNDSAESFLIFEKHKLTGRILTAYQGELSAFIEKDNNGYMLIVHQGQENVFTLRFTQLLLENNLYNYSGIGHFWIDKYEYLRQLEYQIAVIRDKYDYLGGQFCTPDEKTLAHLADFPPLQMYYPAVPLKYRIEKDNAWKVTQEAIDIIADICIEKDDKKLYKALARYAGKPSRLNCMRVAGMLPKNKHAAVVDRLIELVNLTAGTYPKREYTQERQQQYNRVIKAAKQELKAYQSKGMRAQLLVEEPFVYDCDKITFKAHIMVWKKGLFTRKVHIVTFE